MSERATVVGRSPSGTSKASAKECAGSVDSTSVRAPLSAHRNAVAAATVVLPTPPLPVNSRIRTAPRVGASVRRDRGLDPPLELVEGGLDDAALGAPLHEAGDRHDEVDRELVDDVGGAGIALGGLEQV